jgi:hypothetical protein
MYARTPEPVWTFIRGDNTEQVCKNPRAGLDVDKRR